MKTVLRFIAPRLFKWIQMAKSSRALANHLRNNRKIYHTIGKQTDYRIASGPFQGMSYFRDLLYVDRLPFLAGTYELELHGVVEFLCNVNYNTVIDIGCAEGYYAVGFASRCQNSAVLAFDIDEKSRRLCAELASMNSVAERVSILPTCTCQLLNESVNGRTLVICDCEGCEQELLDPERCPSLAFADILVETHDILRPGVSSILKSRFKTTHATTILTSRTRAECPDSLLPFLPYDQKLTAIREHRGCQQEWLFLKSNAGQ